MIGEQAKYTKAEFGNSVSICHHRTSTPLSEHEAQPNSLPQDSRASGDVSPSTPSVLGATDLAHTRSVLPASCIATITPEDSETFRTLGSLFNLQFNGRDGLTVFQKRLHGPGGAQVRGTQESIRNNFRELV